jgi:hypothetical protein
MGKGLSELQIKILKMAYKNRNRGSGSGDVTNREVLIGVYGFRPLYSLQEKRNGAIIFDRQAIGINLYRSASVSVAKAFNRLADRGLARRKYGHGIILTDEGFKVAETLA